MFPSVNVGKTTVTQAVKDTLNGVLLQSPPACISQWRTVFDDKPTPIKRAFYAAGNYILASEIAKASTQAPVIVDRFVYLRSPLISVPSHSCSVLQAVSDCLSVSSGVLFWVFFVACFGVFWKHSAESQISITSSKE